MLCHRVVLPCLCVLVALGAVASASTINYQYEKGVVSTLQHCPGYYCGRTLLSNGSWSGCGRCERGMRRNASSACSPCSDTPSFYDWLYLGFMMLTPLVLHLLCVDISIKKNKLEHRVWLVYVSVVVEAVLASIITLLVTPPLGSLSLSSCRPRDLRDWYPIMYNPNPNYEGVLYCTQEAVYPMYTMVLVGYSTLLVLMLVLRPAIAEIVAQKAKVDDAGAIYSALYLLPSLSVIHAFFAGVVYTIFPYLVIVGSIISIATYLAYQGDQRVRVLIRVFFRDKRSVLILLGHWCLHAYGIIALTQLTEPVVHASLCALVPVPALFYVLTARFSDPTKVQGCSIPPSTGRT
ncbi:Protein of unknown function DUF766 [Trinorchestia longiramus]|nr:Protein of unknown function DUF766 [Trinorchestia longiramus]